MKYTEADRGKGPVEEFKFQIFGNLRELTALVLCY